MSNLKENFISLVEVIKQLRDPVKGCPWDLKQTHKSLTPYLLEESYELIDAINNDEENILDELGDVLLQVLLHSQIASENNKFDINDVINNLKDKMITRHPHVFSNIEVNSVEDVLTNWENIKNKENKTRNTIPEAMPALLKAKKIASKENKKNAFSKKDLLDALRNNINDLETEEKFSNALYSLVSLSLILKIDPEISLQKLCNQKINS